MRTENSIQGVKTKDYFKMTVLNTFVCIIKNTTIIYHFRLLFVTTYLGRTTVLFDKHL